MEVLEQKPKSKSSALERKKRGIPSLGLLFERLLKHQESDELPRLYEDENSD